MAAYLRGGTGGAMADWTLLGRIASWMSERAIALLRAYAVAIRAQQQDGSSVKLLGVSL